MTEDQFNEAVQEQVTRLGHEMHDKLDELIADLDEWLEQRIVADLDELREDVVDASQTNAELTAENARLKQVIVELRGLKQHE